MPADPSKSPFYLIDTSQPFYRPVGRRVTICVSTVLWALFELWLGNPFWMVISAAVAVYCCYVLLYTYRLPEEKKPVSEDDPGINEED